MADDLERTALALVMALEREDAEALPALFLGEDGPVDDLELIITLARLSGFLAAMVGANADPPTTGAAVLADLALEWGLPLDPR